MATVRPPKVPYIWGDRQHRDVSGTTEQGNSKAQTLRLINQANTHQPRAVRT